MFGERFEDAERSGGGAASEAASLGKESDATRGRGRKKNRHHGQEGERHEERCQNDEQVVKEGEVVVGVGVFRGAGSLVVRVMRGFWVGPVTGKKVATVTTTGRPALCREVWSCIVFFDCVFDEAISLMLERFDLKLRKVRGRRVREKEKKVKAGS